MVRIVLSTIVVLVFLGAPAARFLLRSDPEAEPAPAVPVVTGPVERADSERIVRYSGNLTPEATTSVLPRVAGRITELNARVNQVVTVGEVLARVDDEVLRLQVAQARAAAEAAEAQYRRAVRGARSEELEIARAELEQAQASLETARSNLDRTRRLFDQEAIARREYEEAVDRFQTAETQVENARRRMDLMVIGAADEEIAMARANADGALRQLELAELQLDYATVYAPVAGTVARVFVEVAQTVGRESPIVAIVNDRLIYARIRVPERLYGEFRDRDGEIPVRIRAEAYEHGFDGRVTTVAPTIDPASRTFEVEVAVPNLEGRLRPGMFVNAFFVLESLPDSLRVPDVALHRRSGGTIVYVVTDDAADARAVRPGQSRDGYTVILEGLAGDERIVVEGGAFLSDGDPVRIVETR